MSYIHICGIYLFTNIFEHYLVSIGLGIGNCTRGGKKSPKSCLPGVYILVCAYGEEEETKTTKKVKLRMSSAVSKPQLSPAQPLYVKA